MPPVSRLPLSAKLTSLRGVGPTFAQQFEENGILTLRDLLWSLPYRYIDRGSLKKIGELDARHGGLESERTIVTVLGVIKDIRHTTTRIQRMALTEALLDDDTGHLRLVWFNQAYLARVLKPGDQLLAFGALSLGRQGWEMRGPSFEIMGKSGQLNEDPWLRRFLPLYRKMGPITGRLRKRLVEEALSKALPPEELLPADLALGLPDTLTALKLLHQPLDESDVGELEMRGSPAHLRLASEELFAFALGVALLRAGRMKHKGLAIPTSPELRETLRGMLPFHLTAAQRTAFKEIVEDLTSGRIMNRLLQGDVGSGKTLVAFLSMAMVAETGGQAVLLAPTEVLARQHAATFTRLLRQDSDKLQLLLGAMKTAERKQTLAQIASGQARYIVGTHALFQESVDFANLQLVVVDEQHRFGVKQREALKAKGQDPHWLTMSATPIPRSLALAVFGDLDQSVLDELPPGRQPITSRLIDPDHAERAWDLVERELEKGHQAFIVSPAIDVQSAQEEGKRITAQAFLRDIQVMEGLLRARFPQASLTVVHGRLKAEALEARMEAFVSGQAQILLATTVIEVGVDVPNATVMVVDHAERFGLSQLHQLRGRIGRGQAKSHFVMISGSETERLQALVETSDGFRIAQKDLELRGPGEFFGTRQSGVPQFQVADLVRDRQLLSKCREAAEKAVQRGIDEKHLAWLKQERVRLKLAEIS